MVVVALYIFVPIFTFVFIGGWGGGGGGKKKEKSHFKPNCVANKKQLPNCAEFHPKSTLPYY